MSGGEKRNRELFKAACEGCARSKIKCNGNTPCGRCKKRGVECVYAFKAKRGPKKVKIGKPDPLEGVVGSFLSSYERRIWSLFFTIFKNQKKNAELDPFSWGWFMEQLGKLKAYVQAEEKNDAANPIKHLLEKFCEMLRDGDTTPTGCDIPAHICAICHVAVFKSDSPDLHAHLDRKFSLPILQLSELKNLNPWNISAFDSMFANNKCACLIYTSSPDHYGVFANREFEALFGLEQAELMNLLFWSNGGFLPWGADILSSFFVHESDCLLYMRIMAMKYQAQGLPAGKELDKMFPAEYQDQRDKMSQHLHDHSFSAEQAVENGFEFTVPSLHSFLCWVKSSGDDLQGESNVGFVPVQVTFCATMRIRKGRKSNDTQMRFEVSVVSYEAPLKPMDESSLPERVEHVIKPNTVGGKAVPVGLEAHRRNDVWFDTSKNTVLPHKSLTLKSKKARNLAGSTGNSEGSSLESSRSKTTFEELNSGLDRPSAWPEWNNSRDEAGNRSVNTSLQQNDASGEQREQLEGDDVWLRNIYDWNLGPD